MAISPGRIFSLKCLGSADRQHQILRGDVLSGNVDLAADDATSSGAQWAALDAGSSQVFIKCLADFKSSKFSTIGALAQPPFLEGKKDGHVGLAPKTAAEDATLTGTRWTVIDLGGNRLALQCYFLGKSSKSTIGTSGSREFLNGENGGVKLGVKDAIGTHWEVVALGPPGDPKSPSGLHDQH